MLLSKQSTLRRRHANQVRVLPAIRRVNVKKILRIGAVLGTLALALGLAGPAGAQEAETFTITGRALTESGEPLQYTVVGIAELRTFALSDENGQFTLQNVQAGQWRFIALKRGYYYANQFVAFSGPADIELVLEQESADAPVELGRIVGTVFDQETGNTVRDAEISIEPFDRTVSTNRSGQYAFDELSIGAVRLTTTRLGYKTRVDTLAVLPGMTLRKELYLVPEALELEPLFVEAQVLNRYLESNGFYRRVDQGLGTQWTRADIDERNPVYTTDMFNTVPGVRKGRDRFGTVVLQSTRDNCALTTYLDGMRTPGFDLDTYPPDYIEAIEIYRGQQVPPEYRDSCGVVLVWTRRG
jgi:hypothetical protein